MPISLIRVIRSLLLLRGLYFFRSFFAIFLHGNKNGIIFAPAFRQKCRYMVDVAQLVRASDCGSEGRGFEPHYPPWV